MLTDIALESVLDQIPVSMVILARDGTTLRANQAYLDLFGYASRGDVEGQHMPLRDPPVRALATDAFVKRALAGEVTVIPAAPLVLQRPRGEIRCNIRVTMIPVKDVTGEVQRLVVVHEDVTALTASEQEWQRRDRLLVGLQGTYRRIANHLQVDAVIAAVFDAVEVVLGGHKVALWEVDSDGVWRCVATRNLTDEFESRLSAIRLTVPALENVTLAIARKGEPWTYDTRHPNPEFREYRELLDREGIRYVAVVPLRSGDGVVGTLSLYRTGDGGFDETDIEAACLLADQAASALHNAQLFQQLAAMRDELEGRVRASTEELRVAHTEAVANERLAALGFLAKEVAHGLRNPLNVISASMYYIRSRWTNPDEKVDRHFDAVSRAVSQAADTITDLVTLAGGANPAKARLNFGELAQRAVLERLTSNQVPVDTDWATGLPPTCGDWAQVLQAMKSLLANAAAARQIEPVRVVTSLAAGHVVFSVGDDRPDVPPENLEATLGPFTSTATQWTGLSLTVARQIARRHNGYVTVVADGGITWFRLHLPAEDGTAN